MAGIITGAGVGLENSSSFVLGGRGLIGSASTGRFGTNVFVNASNGNLVIKDQDEYLVGRGPDALVNRTYNSQGLLDDDNGDNWRNGAQRLVTLVSGTLNAAGSVLRRVDWDGSVALYNYVAGSNRYVTTAGAGSYDKIEYTNGEFTWTDGSTQTREVYDASQGGRITLAKDLDGNEVQYSYTGLKLTSIVTANQERIEFGYTGNNLTSIQTFKADNSLLTARTRYTYDSLNRLSSVIVDLTPEDISDDKVVVRSYTYDGTSNRIASISETGAENFIAFTYTLVGGEYRVETISEPTTNSGTRVTTFSYDVASRLTSVTDALSNVTRIAYNADGSLGAMSTLASGSGAPLNSWTFGYDAQGNVLTTARPGGALDTATYDASGNLLSLVGPTGEVVTYTYGSRNELLTETVWQGLDPDGPAGPNPPTSPATTRYVYDGNNRLAFVVSAEGRVTEYAYNGFGQRTSMVRYTNVAYPNLSSLAPSDPIDLSAISSWRNGVNRSTVERTDTWYDFRGNIEKIIEWSATNSAGDGAAGINSTTLYYYDPSGRLIGRRELIKAVQEAYVYDGLGRVQSATDRYGVTTSYVYNDASKYMVQTTANGLTSVFLYANDGSVIGGFSSGSEVSSSSDEYRYDVLGRLKSTQYNLNPDDIAIWRDYTFYDGVGRKTGYVDILGNITEYKWNSSNQIYATVTYAAKISSNAAADLFGSIAMPDRSVSDYRPAANAADRWAFNVYDQAGNIIQTIDGTGSSQTYQYDGVGRLVSTRRSDVLLSDTLLAALKAGSQVPTLNVPAASADDRLSRTFYDKDGLVIGTIDGKGAFIKTVYDQAGRKIETVAYAKLASAAAQASGSFATIEADVSAPANPLDRHTYYVYDGRGDIRYVVDGSGRVTEHRYGVNRELLVSLRYGGTIALASSYNLASVSAQISSLNLQANAQTRVSQNVYLADGRLGFAVDAEGYVERYFYDSAGNVSKTVEYVTRYAGALDPGYLNMAMWADGHGAAGDRTRRSYYDNRSQLAYRVDAEGYIDHFTYDSRGNVTLEERISTQFTTINDQTSLSQIAGLVAGQARIQGRLMSYDGAGNATTIINFDGRTTNRQYNAFGQLEKEVVGFPNVAGGTSLYALGVDVAWYRSTYPEIGAQDPIAHYDQYGRFNGYNPNAYFDTNWYLEQHPSLATSGQNPLEHFLTVGWGLDYRPNANATVGDYAANLGYITTVYSYDRAGRVATVVSGSANPLSTSGKTSAIYTYNSFGDVVSKTDGRNNTTTYEYDQVGNLKRTSVPLGDTTSAVTVTEYDAFGNAVKVTDPRNNSSFSYFDKLNRLWLQIDAEGYATEFTYGRGNQIEATRRYYTRPTGSGSTDVIPTLTTGANDAVTSFVYDKIDRVVKVTDAMGFSESYDLDAFGNRKKVKNKLDGDSFYEYDKLNRKTSERSPLSAGTVSEITQNTFEYDARGNLKKFTEAVGEPEERVTFFNYDISGRLVEKYGELLPIVNSLGVSLPDTAAHEYYKYDPRGNLITVTNAALQKTHYYYDSLDRKVAEVNAVGTLSTWEYDANGNVIATRVYSEPVDLSSALGASRPAALHYTDTEFRETKYVYDKNNRLISTVVEGVRAGAFVDGAYVTGWQNVIATNEYDAMGNLVLQTDAMGGKIYSYFDKNGRKTAQVDQLGYLTTWTFDGEGNALSETRYANPTTGMTVNSTVAQLQAATTTSLDDRTTIFTYDLNGNRKSATRLNVRYSTVSSAGVLSTDNSTNFAGYLGNSVITYSYNGLRQVTEKTQYFQPVGGGDPALISDKVGYTYDKQGQLIRVTKPTFAAVTSAPVDGQAAVTVNAAIVTDYLYDGLKNLVSQTVAAINPGTLSFVGGQQSKTTYTYGVGGRLLSIEDPNQKTRSFAYDIMGNIIVEQFQRTTPDGIETNGVIHGYDALGRETSKWNAKKVGNDWVGMIDVRTRYNAFGEIAAKGYGDVWQETYEYNRRGQLRKTNSINGSYELYVYDRNGNMTLKMQSSSSSYVTSVNLKNHSVESALAILTANGTKAIGDASINSATAGVLGITPTIYVYDSRNQLVTTREPRREYSFNQNGSQGGAAVTTAKVRDVTTGRTYNAFGEVATERSASDAVTTYAYNTMGKLTTKTMPVVTVMGTNGGTSSASPVERYYYDLAGRQIGMMDARGNLTGRVLLAGSGYDGEEARAVLERQADGGTTRMGYDVLGRLKTKVIAVDAVSGRGFDFSYDAVGNMVSQRRGSAVTLGTGVWSVKPSTDFSTPSITDYYGYDELGQRITHANSLFGENGPKEKTWYNIEGWVVRFDDFESGSNAAPGALRGSTTYEYVWNPVIATSGMGDGQETFGAWQKTTRNGAYNLSNELSAQEAVDYYGRTLYKVDFGYNKYIYAYDKAGNLKTEQNLGINNAYANSGIVNTFSYYNSGKVFTIVSDFRVEDKAFGTEVNPILRRRKSETNYQYDSRGNRTYERQLNTYYTEDADIKQTLGLGTVASYTVVDKLGIMSYDALNRMTLYTDNGFQVGASYSNPNVTNISYKYDAAGNVINTNASYYSWTTGATLQTKDYYYSYDAVNRFLVTRGVLSGSTITTSSAGGTRVTYNLAGDRISASTYTGTSNGFEVYAYDLLGDLKSVSMGTSIANATLRASYKRDALGRVTEYSETDGITTTYSRMNIVYDRTGLILFEQSKQKTGTNAYSYFTTYYDYTYNTSSTLKPYGTRLFFTPAAHFQGALTHVVTYKSSTTSPIDNTYANRGSISQETEYFYRWTDEALKNHVGIFTGTFSSYSIAYNDLEYDTSGNLTGIEFDVKSSGSTARTDFVNTVDGKVMARYTSRSNAQTSYAMDFHYYGNDTHLGAIGNDGAPEYNYRNAIDHRYDTASTTAFRYGSAQSFVDFDQSYEMINPTSQNGTSSAYTVQAGDTLQTLALAYWGDSSLWYLIADANGLSGSETLAAGTSLWVPSRVVNVHNSASTFKPYDPNEAQVNTDPLAPSPKKAKKCGGLGAVIVIAVAVAVTAIATAGIGALATGASFSSALSSLGSLAALSSTAVGSTALGSVGAIGAFAAGAAIGSIASQGLGIAMGLQSKFSFKGVALAAIAGGISGGIGQSSLFSSLGPVGGAIARGTVANVATQGIGVATGLQNRFNWSGVASGAAGSGIGMWTGGGIVGGAAGGVAASAAEALVTGRDFGDTLLSNLPGIIGNTIGNLVASEVAGDPTRSGSIRTQRGRVNLASVGSEGEIVVTAQKAQLGIFGSIHKGLSGVDRFFSGLSGSFDTSEVARSISMTLRRAGKAANSAANTIAASSVYQYSFGQKSLYDRHIVQPFYVAVDALANSPLGDPGVGMAIEQAMAGTPYTAPIAALGAIQSYGARGLQTLSRLSTIARADSRIVIAAETAVPRTFRSSDPLVGNLANEIEAAYPGHVVGVNVPVRNAAGQLVTDADIQLQNAIIQVKSGGGKGLTSQLLRTEQATGMPTIGYGPTLKPSVVRSINQAGGLVTTDQGLLIEVVKP